MCACSSDEPLVHKSLDVLLKFLCLNVFLKLGPNYSAPSKIQILRDFFFEFL